MFDTKIMMQTVAKNHVFPVELIVFNLFTACIADGIKFQLYFVL